MRIGVKRLTFEYEGEEAEVSIRKPTVSQVLSYVEKVRGVEEWQQALPAMYDFLDELVLSWNFEDVDGREIAVAPETIRALPLDLVLILAKEIQEVCAGVPLASRRTSNEPSSSET